MFSRTLMAAFWLAVSAAAAPPLSTIQDVLYKADGSRFSGTLTISWKSFQPADGSAVVPQGSTVVKVLDGYLRVQLVPTANATPAASYAVLYTSNGRTQFRESWSVPASTTPLRVHDVRVALAGNSGGSVNDGSSASDTNGSGGPIAESGITGLLADLGARPVKGPNYAAGRVAAVDAAGLLASVTGDPADCVHVDGSAGPCGTGGSGAGALGSSVAFVDADTLGGLVDGSNTVFGLSATPAPASSLAVYRNGVLQKASQDYSLSGGTVQFVAAAPQPGDTLLASYRVANSGVASGPSPQVLCSGVGSATQSTTPTTIGTCTIAPGVLASGDRIEVKFDTVHTGSAGSATLQVVWGATQLLNRTTAANETLFTGRLDASLQVSGAQASWLSWGTASALGSGIAAASDAYSGGITVALLGSVAQSSDTVSAINFTVVRTP